MNNESVLGVIGCGYWGPNLIRNFSALSGCRVKWACDREEARFDRLSKLYPDIQFTADANAIMDDDEVDAIAIATPVTSHFHLAQRSLLAGKHVFVEKPMAHSTAECQTLLDLAKAGGLSIMVGHTFVYTAAVRKMKEIIEGAGGVVTDWEGRPIDRNTGKRIMAAGDPARHREMLGLVETAMKR